MGGLGRQTSPPGVAGHPDRGFSFFSLPAPKAPGFSPINFPGALPASQSWLAHPSWGAGEERRAPSPFARLQGLPFPAPAHFLATEARAPAEAARRLRPPPPFPKCPPLLRALRWERGVRWAGVPSSPSRRTQVGARGC